MSQRLIVLSADAVANTFENGRNFTEVTESTWPRNILRQDVVFMSRSLAVWSMEPRLILGTADQEIA